ncbi:hypothetical protein Q5H93_03275 [Hymenobacter sp. ASUV-10]|uniref:Glycosyltransferase RgtA/B/C/D-like domain-containing protein n=1 Tax=Hymenobacter aranciens TaxID=3063996 RepID=A0ABT9B693_9BACT|nr:hypothetical protein [Hymenobacter sp. ASUV-10]MDO7873740.1 hypothetical protein [Hymenobacter sp. ASUV-10]
MPPFRYFLQVGLLLLLLTAGYAALLLHQATLPAIQALDHITQHMQWHIRPVQAAELRHLLVRLEVVVALAGGALLALSRRATGRREWQLLGWEVKAVASGITACFQRLPGQQRALFWLLLGFLTALRTYFSLTKPLHGEELASYEFFVRPGLLATSAYYPIPNNHVLSNTISGWLYLLSPNFWWCMRLPVLLISTLGTVLLFGSLLRVSNFRVAAVATFLFSWLQLSLYNASAARGYWLLITLAGLVFFATLALSNARARRAAWAALLVGGVLGSYTIPSFAYVLVAAFSWLGLVFLRQKRWPELAQAIAIGTLTILGATLLYSPLLLVSGLDVLTGNGFVAPRPAAEFWTGLPAYLWFNEGLLAGQRSIGAVLTLAGLLSFGYLLLRYPASTTSRFHRLGKPALWFTISPYALVVMQRVFPPERVFLYKAFFFFILVALLADWWLRRPLSHLARRWSQAMLLVSVLIFIVYQTYTVERLNRRNQRPVAAYQAGFEWLAAQPPGPVLAPEPLHNLYFRFFGHALTPARRWRFAAAARPATPYAYVLAFPNQRGYFQPKYPFPPAYRNPEVEIYRLPKGFQLP